MVVSQDGLKSAAWLLSVFPKVFVQAVLLLLLPPSSSWVAGVSWATYPGPQHCEHSSAPRKERWWMWMPRWPQSCGAPGLQRSSCSELKRPMLLHCRGALARG